MKRHSKLFGSTLLCVGWTSLLFAGNAFYNFDHYPPPLDPALTAGGAIFIGTHNSTGAGPGATNYQTWCSGAPLNPSGAGTGTNGFPKTGGYLSISDATNGNNNLVIVFPDIDNGLPIQGFQLDMDMRVGNSSLGRPADGFSISFARSGDPVLVNATNLVVGGFAGGDGSYAAAQSPAGSTDVENGTKTGVAIVFDAWQGNWLPDTTLNSGGSSDREGIAVRVDDHTQVQLDLVNNRNERDCTNITATGLAAGFVGSAAQTNLNNPNSGGVGGLSEQTGTNAFFTGNNLTCGATYGGTDTSGSFTNLYWEHLLVRLTNISSTSIPTNNLTVVWKGVQVVSTNLTAFSPTVGRLILAGRTGGNMQHCHVDNLNLVTTPTTNTFIVKVSGALNGFSFQLSDNGSLTVTNVQQVVFDAADVSAQVLPSVSYLAPITSGGFTNPTLFVSRSAHLVTLKWLDNLGATNIGAVQFTVPPYAQFPTNFALPLSAIDTTKQGFLLTAYQTTWNNPNVIAWTDETLEGLHGTNMVNAATTGNPIVNGYQVWTNVMGFYNYGGKSGNIGTPGLYSGGGDGGILNGVANGDKDFIHVGLGISTYPQDYRHDFYDNIILEFFGYIYFPTSGLYNFSFGNDDQYQVTTSSSPYDRMGTIIAASSSVRVPNANSLPVNFADIQTWYVTQPGAYPIRVVWENGTGGCVFEWYTYTAPGPNTPGFGSFLVNDAVNATNVNGVVLLGYYGLTGTVDTGPYLSEAMPPRNPPGTPQTYADMYFYSPIVVELVDGTIVNGTGKTINDSSIALTVDGSPVAVTHFRTNSTTVHIVQSGTPNWASGNHTNNLTFSDMNGTNYVYNWIWAAIGGFNGVSAVDGTNLVNFAANRNVLDIPASLQQPAGAVDVTQPGVRVKSWQTPMEAGQSHSGWSEGELMGQKGWNDADQSLLLPGGYYVWSNLFDFRYDSGGGAGAEWNFDLEDSNPNIPSLFGLGPGAANPVINLLIPPSNLAPSYRIVYSGVNTKSETSAWEFSGWIVFPTSGPYIMNINTDDGLRLMFPQGSPAGKLNPATVPYITNIVAEANVGRGVAGQSGGIYNGGTWVFLNVPLAGAYPFRLLWFNGGGGAGLEWSVIQQLPDGRVSRVPVNDPMTPGSLKVYQALTSGNSVAPYVTHLDPVYDEPDAIFNEPTVVDIADGPSGKTINLANANVQLFSDGIAQNVMVTQPLAGSTHIVQQMASGFFWVNGNHTNILTYRDNLGNTYSNVWFFNARVPNNAQGGSGNIVWVPTSMRVDPSQVDHTQPGFRVKSYEAPAGGGVLGSVNQAEQAFKGVFGPNLITNTPVSGYWTWTNPVDLCDNIGVNGGHGEFRYNYSFSNSFGAVVNTSANPVDGQENNLALIFAGWFEFTQPGMYAMTVNSDDGFQISVPFGMNPFNQQGLILGWFNGGRGDSGGSANPFNLGSSTPVFFNIPAAGDYPFRMIYYNGGGGLAVEWTMLQPQPDGSVERVLIGDNASYPNQVKVYQTLLTNPPTVLASAINSTGTNAPNLVFGAQPQALLGSTLGFGAQTSSQLPLGPAQDYWLTLADGSVGINSNTIVLSLNGVVQPITVVSNAGITTVYRFGTNGLWPSGAYAPLMISFQDNNGASYSYPLEWVITPFWGTLHHGFPINWGDPNSPGFKVRTAQLDPGYTSQGVNKGPATTGPATIANRVHTAEQRLAGLWGPNFALLGPTNYPGGPFYGGFTDFGYFDVKGTGPTNGVINLNAQYPAQAGNFQSSVGPYFNLPIPGLPGTGPTPNSLGGSAINSAAVEILAYVAFPTNGMYTLGISSDDGFRVMQQWNPPTNIAAITINSPPAIARQIPAVINVFEQQGNMSCPLTNPITGNLVLASGSFGASTNGEGCIINNGSAIAGNIALMYQLKNGVCNIQQQVMNAAAAGAQAVVLISKHTPTTDGVFSDEQTVSPMQKIPLVVIEESDGTNIVAALQSGAVNVTLTPSDYSLNPPDDRVLGQTSVGKGNSDCNFTVVVTNAPGLYPLRVTYFQGGGGVNLDWYSITGSNGTNGNRILINDSSNTNGIALNAYFNLFPPQVTNDGVNLHVTYVGTLLTSTDPTLPIGSWTTVATPSPITIPISGSLPKQFFRAVYAQRP